MEERLPAESRQMGNSRYDDRFRDHASRPACGGTRPGKLPCRSVSQSANVDSFRSVCLSDSFPISHARMYTITSFRIHRLRGRNAPSIMGLSLRNRKLKSCARWAKGVHAPPGRYWRTTRRRNCAQSCECSSNRLAPDGEGKSKTVHKT